MAWIKEILNGAWTTFVVLSPSLLFGLVVSGIINILITRRRIESLMGTEGLKSVMVSAAAGVPLPLCSCAVVPVVVTLGKKGAAPSSIMSFLITTPESGVDSILITWVLMGPWAAIFRPIASVLTALLGGVLAIGLLPPFKKRAERRLEPAHEEDHKHKHEHEHEHEHGHADCGHNHGPEHGHHHHGHELTDPEYVGLKGIWLGIKHYVRVKWRRFVAWGPLDDWYKPAFYRKLSNRPPEPRSEGLPEGVPPIGETCRRVFRYSFVELADDILFSVMVGVLLSGVILAVFPSDLERFGLGNRWLSYIVMVAVGIPMYICASASTPIAAALVMKGLSPGAAIVFILSGPATNTTTIIALTKQFGRRFVAIYVFSIAVGSIATGAAFDLLVDKLGWKMNTGISISNNGVIAWIEWVSAAFLMVLTLWRFKNGAFAAGVNDLIQNTWFSARKLGEVAYGGSLAILGPTRAVRIRTASWVLAIGYLATGIFTVPPGSVGYGKLFGKVFWRNLEPGLHVLPPMPFVKVDIWPIKLPRRLTIGLMEPTGLPVAAAPSLGRTTNSVAPVYGEVKRGSNLVAAAATDWHVPGARLARKGEMAEFLAGDQNFIKIVITVVYNIVDPYAYYYRVENPERVLGKAIQSSAREYVAQNSVSDLLSRNYQLMEAYIMKDVHSHSHPEGATVSRPNHKGHIHLGDQTDNELADLGINLQSVNLIDIHPPEETVAAFRDVGSAAQDGQRSILDAEKLFTLMIPQAAGNALIEVKTAEASAAGMSLTASAESKSIMRRADQIGADWDVLENVLWFETVERALSGKEMFILPPGVSARDLILWRAVRGGKGKHDRKPEVDRKPESE